MHIIQASLHHTPELLSPLAALLGQGSAVTAGNFDGLHLGHQSIITALKEEAARLGLPSALITFSPNPRLFFRRAGGQGASGSQGASGGQGGSGGQWPSGGQGPSRGQEIPAGAETAETAEAGGMGGAAAPAASRPTAAPTAADSAARDLTPLPQKLEMLEALGVDITLVLKFDQELADQEAEAFIRGFLLPVLRCRSVVAGYDCSFGKGREGNADLLRRVAQTLPAGQGFSVREEAPLLVKGEPVSSTRIRKLLLAGEIADLPALLGRRYTVFGPVVEGYRRGGPLLGFPTANIRADDYFLPAQGVYATFVEMGGKLWPSVSSLGFNPSFGNQSISLETHILDFSGDLYGQNLTLHFVERLRPEQRFNSLEDLKRHIQLDIDHARRIFAAI